MNDVWIFDIYSRKWTWVSASHSENGVGIFPNIGGSGLPSGRVYSGYWTSLNGELFLFGGYGISIFFFHSTQCPISYMRFILKIKIFILIMIFGHSTFQLEIGFCGGEQILPILREPIQLVWVV